MWSDTSAEFGPRDALAHRSVDLSFDTCAIYSTRLANYTSKPGHIIPTIQRLANKITTSLAGKLRKSSQTCIVHTADAIDIYSAVYVFISVYNFDGPIGAEVGYCYRWHGGHRLQNSNWDVMCNKANLNEIKGTSGARLREINDVTLFMLFAILEKHLFGIPRVRYFLRVGRQDVALLTCKMWAMSFDNFFKARCINNLKYWEMKCGTCVGMD